MFEFMVVHKWNGITNPWSDIPDRSVTLTKAMHWQIASQACHARLPREWYDLEGYVEPSYSASTRRRMWTWYSSCQDSQGHYLGWVLQWSLSQNLKWGRLRRSLPWIEIIVLASCWGRGGTSPAISLGLLLVCSSDVWCKFVVRVSCANIDTSSTFRVETSSSSSGFPGKKRSSSIIYMRFNFMSIWDYNITSPQKHRPASWYDAPLQGVYPTGYGYWQGINQ